MYMRVSADVLFRDRGQLQVVFACGSGYDGYYCFKLIFVLGESIMTI
jgi:hypothetical protein